MGALVDNLKEFSRRTGKVRGILEGRLQEDLQNPNLEAFVQTIRIILSLRTKNELIKFLQYKIKTPPYGDNYTAVYTELLGNDLFKKLRADKLTDPEKNAVCSKFVERALKNRAIVFYGDDSSAVLRDGKEPSDGSYFLAAAKDVNVLKLYLSYSEFEFSRRIALSSSSDLYKFAGVKHEKISLQPILVHAQGGLRLDRLEFSEYSRVIISEKSRPDLFKELDAKKIMKMQAGDSIKIKGGTIDCMVAQPNPPVLINKSAFKNLIRDGYETYLADANRKATEDNKQAYVRLLSMDDSSATIFNCENTSEAVHDLFADLYYQAIKEIVDHPNFDKDHPQISQIELSHPRWKLNKTIKNKKIIYKEGTQEDKSMHFAAPMDGVTEKGSSATVLLCINMPSSPNAYLGNRIYNNKLSYLDAEIANCTNVTTLFNPDINSLFTQPDVATRILICLPNAAMKTLDEMLALTPEEVTIINTVTPVKTASTPAVQQSLKVASEIGKTLLGISAKLGALLLTFGKFLFTKIRGLLQKKQ